MYNVYKIMYIRYSGTKNTTYYTCCIIKNFLHILSSTLLLSN